MSSSYKKAHVYFLQAVMNRGLISESECGNICQTCCQLANEQFDGRLQDFIDVINHQLQSFHFKIRHCKREDTGELVYVLASVAEHDLNRLITNGDFSRQELDFFRRIVELIVHSDHPENAGTASSIDILNLADTLTPKISKVDAKTLLSKLVDDQWFYENDGMVSMSPRTILELEAFLADMYDVKVCQMCQMSVFQGQCCENCPERMHHFCAARCVSNSVKCAKCGNAWSCPSRNAATVHTQVNEVASTSNSGQRPRKRSRPH